VKKNNLFIFFLLCVFLFNFSSKNVYASNKKALLTGNQVSLRTGPGTKYDSIASLSLGAVYSLVDDSLYNDEGGTIKCESGSWYRINYNNTTGYVCSSYISLISDDDTSGNPSTNCEQEMSNLGFPSSYWSGLCSLKEKYPNWNFVALKTNLDWATAVSQESACGNSYIATSNSNYIDSSCKNAYTKTWYPASQTAVAYYMDPRNWLDEKYIFQFEYLKYDNNLSSSYPSAVANILKNAAFYTYHTEAGNNLSEIINSSGSSTNVSPTFLSSRMLQELGSGTSLYNLYSGVYTENNKEYYGYYNFFNYGVTDSCATTNGTSYCGLSVAKTFGWNSVANAISGASSKLSSSYIAVGQYTTYLQKYNVVPENITKLYTHQYMTNVAAPSSESKTTYNTYNNLGILSGAFTFYIPVYENMSATITNTSNGAVASPDTTESNISISTIVKSSGYNYSDGYISGIAIGTEVSSVISSLQAISGSSNIVIKNQNGDVVTSGKIGTGFKVSVANSTSSEELNVVISGDTSGDGEITALDLLQIQKNLLGTYSLNDSYLKAGDTSKDGQISALDLLQVQKYLLGTYNIEQ
jgi:beta-N-acetylglucosaminidase